MRALDPKMIFDGEHIVYRTGYHWVYIFRAFFPLLTVLILGSLVWSFFPSRITSGLIVLALLASVVWVVIKVVETVVKKAYVTNKRLIYRVGWTYRDTVDVTLDRIGGIKLDQDVWQRFFGYGTVQVIVPVVEIILPRFLRNPISFRNALYMQQKPPEKEDDDVIAEEEARLAREREEEEDDLETVPYSQYETSSIEAGTETELGADLGAEVSADVSSEAVESVDVAVDTGDDGSSDT